MRIDITNQSVTKDGKPLEGVVWADPEVGEACIFCYDHLNRKVPTDQDPTGYETLVVRGTIAISEGAPSQSAVAQLSFEWGALGYPACVQVGNPNLQSANGLSGIDPDGRNGSSFPCANPEPADSDFESFTCEPKEWWEEDHNKGCRFGTPFWDKELQRERAWDNENDGWANYPSGADNSLRGKENAK